jgi:hypothetical protein
MIAGGSKAVQPQDPQGQAPPGDNKSAGFLFARVPV